MRTTDSFTAELWADTKDVYAAILEHPFVTGLTSGELDHDRFGRYIVQDTHYLRHYARALRVLSSRADDDATAEMFGTHAASAIAVEQELHAGYLAELGLRSAGSALPPPTPTTVAYTSYLMAVTHGGSFADGLAAVLPCYWIYWEVGQTLLEASSPDPLYARWIATYGDETFGRVVRDVLALTDRVGQTAPSVVRERMQQHYRVSARYEWMFWDAAYRDEQWPV